MFSNVYLRFWDQETIDINILKRIKFQKRIKDIIHSPCNKTVVIYEDGSCEFLQTAMNTRKEQKKDNKKIDFTIEDPRITPSGIFSYIRKMKHEKTFCFTYIDSETMRPIGDVQSFAIIRKGRENLRLIGSTVITSNNESSFISIWSDKRVFSYPLDINSNQTSVGANHSSIDLISGKHNLAITTISDKCIAIYACNEEEENSSFLIYNLKYKVIQSRIEFKVFIPLVKLWTAYNHVFVALGQFLKAVSYKLAEDKLSSMIGAQSDLADKIVDNEMINEDFCYEEALEFDENQDPVEGMEFVPNNRYWKQPKRKGLSGAKKISGSDEVKNQMDELYRGDMIVELVKSEDQPNETVYAKLLSNVDEESISMSESVEFYCMDLERHGYSEIEITNKVIPVLIKANRSEDIGLLLKRYNNISERMLVLIIKYILKCPDEAEEKMEVKNSNGDVVALKKDDLSFDKKFANQNAFLSTKQNEKRDVLSIALCCAFDSTTTLPFIRQYISFPEMVQLMDHLYKILTMSVLNDPYDMRGNLVEGDDFDIDSKLFEWFRLLLDSHCQQILLSRDKDLGEKLDQWLQLIDTHIGILTEMKSLRPLLSKLSGNKSLQLSKKCNQWYTIEKLKLY